MDKGVERGQSFLDSAAEAMRGSTASAKAPPRGGVHQTAGENAPVGDSANGTRREPEPLRATLPPAQPYPVEALGPVLGAAARALHDAIKAPLVLCCQSVLAGASLAAQAHYDVQLPWGQIRPLSLFMATVGESGERKTAVDDVVLGAAKNQERTDLETYQTDLGAYELELESWKQAGDAAKRAATTKKAGLPPATKDDVLRAIQSVGEKPIPPVMPLRFLTDPTIEGQFKLMALAQPSVALFSDEGGLLIGGYALNSDNALKTMARWCKIWDGSPFDRVRAGDGAAILYGRRMAMHQLAQPDVMTLLLSDRMANGQGLLSRCLVAWPESTIGTRQTARFEKPEDRREVKRLLAVLTELMEAEPTTGKSKQELDPRALPLNDDAEILAVAGLNEFEKLMAVGADLAELRDRTSKALENACRIAGVTTAIDNGLSAQEIDRPHLEQGLILMQWYLYEALRIRAASAVPQSVLDAESLSRWLKDRNLRMFRSHHVLNAGPSHLRNKPRFVNAVKELEENGYLTKNEPGTLVDGVRTKLSWTVLHHVV